MPSGILVTLQFPIADARCFDADRNLRLTVPDWPAPATGLRRQFVNYFGPAVDRRREPDMSHPDEAKFCLARRALRFEKSWTKKTSPNFVEVDCAFRRLFCDGSTVVRTEIGFRLKRGWPKPEYNWTSQDLLKLVSGICNLPTHVGGESESRPMINQGAALARIFARATSPARSGPWRKRAAELVQSGNPLVILELTSNFPIPQCPKGFNQVPPEQVGGSALYFGRLQTRLGPVPTWILHPSSDPPRGRLLRLCLLRLHAEQETLDLAIKLVRRGSIPRTGALDDEDSPHVIDNLDSYFNQKTKLLSRQTWHGLSQSAVLEAFDAADSVTEVSTRLTRAHMYEGARQQIWKKLQHYATRRNAVRQVSVVNVCQGGVFVEKQNIANVSGSNNIVNVADFMSDVRNEVNSNLSESKVPEEVTNLIAQLVAQLESIGSKIDRAVLERMSTDVKALSQEVTLQEPRRKWYEVSLNGLKEAAEAVGEIASPVVATVTKLMSLLLGAA